MTAYAFIKIIYFSQRYFTPYLLPVTSLIAPNVNISGGRFAICDAVPQNMSHN